jgi:UDP-glucose 4-epimerase
LSTVFSPPSDYQNKRFLYTDMFFCWYGVLVTGGAGYIGSAAVRELVSKYDVIVVDNLSNGKNVDKSAKFYHIDINDDLEKVFSENKIDYIIHFAAYKSVEESMEDAVKYSENITGSINLLNLAVKHNVKKFIFSSTAAVYAEQYGLIDEDGKKNPVSFYGYGKLNVEELLKWYNQIHGLDYISLRYFNVAGGYVEGKNIFAKMIDALNGSVFEIYGDDYDTPDGTGVRDYIDLRDLIRTHFLAMKSDYTGVLNLGSSKGYSVKEVVESFREVTGKDIPIKIMPRRKGDLGKVVCSNKKAKEVLGWEPEYGLKDMVKSTAGSDPHA